MISIKDNKIKSDSIGTSYSYEETPNHSGIFTDNLPDTIVIHYTAGSSYGSSVNWLKNTDANASAHLVIGRKGEVVQLLPFNQIAWHAGKSEWKGRKGLNKYSIGIEIANAGILVKRPTGYYTSFGKKVEDDKVIIAKHKHKNEEMAWECYTDKQIEVVEEICLALKSNYKISEIVGHEDIAPGRKTDPGPAFPLQSLRNKVLFGRLDENEEELLKPKIIKGIVTANRLNIRDAPNVDSSTVSEPLLQGTRLNILKIQGEWLKVKIETEGWVSKRYVKYFE